MRTLRFAMISLLALGFAFTFTSAARSQCPPPAAVHLQPIGHPIWTLVDFHVFTAPMGGAKDNYAEFAQTSKYLLFPIRHKYCAELGRGPGVPHQPPYTHEMEAGVRIMNYREAYVFSARDFTAPNAVYAAFMVVPSPGKTGSSPDFKTGPIIPNKLFPIHAASATYRNGQLWDPNLGTFDIPALTDKLSCPFYVDGHSHIPMFTGENTDEVPGTQDPTGDYEFRETMTDTTGDGWSITIYFAVR